MGSDCQFELPDDYGYVMLGNIAIAFTCVMIGYTIPGTIRGKVFNREFMKQFHSEHSQEFSNDVTTSQGYPDMGSGIYAQKLPYKDWMKFNCAQRVHHQFLENLVPLILFLMITGVQYPTVAIVLCVVTVIARILYCFYLKVGGAKNPLRLAGALGTDIVLVVGLIMAIISSLKTSCAI